MKLRLTKTPVANSRRQRQTTGDQEKLEVTKTISYRSRRSDDTINLGRQKEKSQVSALKTTYFWLQRSGLIILLVAVVASVINILSLTSSAEILPATTGQTLSSQAVQMYQAAADKELASSALNRNKITVDVNSVSNKLLKQFPDLASASVTVPLVAHRPIVYVEPAQPNLVVVASNGAFALDSGGKAVFEAASANALNLPNLPVLTDQSSLSLKLNQQALPSNYASFIQTVIAQLKAKGFTVSSLTLPASTDELDVGIAGQPYFVKFNLQDNDARQQVGTFLATIAQLQSQNITPTKYVDVRVDGRAYYL